MKKNGLKLLAPLLWILVPKVLLTATTMDKRAPIEARLSALQSLTETPGSEQPATISALADMILKEKEPRIRLAAIQALDAFDWSANTYALAALVLAREEN